MDELIKAMTTEDIEALKAKHTNEPGTIALLEGILEVRAKEAEESKVAALRDKIFVSATNKILGVLPEYTPDWRKDSATQAVIIATVAIDDTSKEQVEVEVEGQPTMRYPKMLVRQVSIGAVPTTKPATTSTPAGSKRAINIFKHNPDGADEAFGQFANYQTFASDKGIETGADSAKRALERWGYYGVPVTT